MAITNEPRALTAALAGPAFTTRGGGLAMHAADRHVERWAPEASASRVRPLRSLGFVDRLIAPWLETAQRSASLRLFSQYAQQGVGERPAATQASWVFPRPWYQDELDWMAAARNAPPAAAQPTLFTTRGTYVAPERPAALPAALYEYVAPSLSIAGMPHEQPPIAGTGFGGEVVGSAMLRNEAYSPLVPLAAVQAAEVMSRTLQRLPAGGARSVERSPALRNVLSTMLARASQPVEQQPTRLAMQAPELVTPPAPRMPAREPEQATQVAERYAEHRAQIVELQRIARHSAERELAARSEPAPPSATVEARGAQAEAEVRQRIATARGEEQRRTVDTQQAAERARIEERIAQRVAERTGAQRLHEQARSEAAAHARAAASEPVRATVSPPATASAPSEVIAAIAALPPELASFLAQRSSTTAAGATQAIDELGEAYRTIELIARNAAVGGTFQSTRGPRLMMPVGLGGLVTAVDRAPALLTGQPALAPLAFAPSTARTATRVPNLSWVSPAIATTSAFGAATSAAPAALGHVAWADRWLARFAGASQQSLDTLSVHAGVESTRGLQALAAAAPHNVFVSPSWFDAQRDATTGRTLVTPSAPAPSVASPAPSVVRYDDDSETPDDVFAAISEAASRGRTTPVTQGAVAPAPVAQPSLAQHATTAAASRTIADTVAHAAPGAPGAGFAAQLASSPFARALRHVLSLPNAASFDVRALFGGALSATYLAGLLAPASHELEVTAGRALPVWASWSLDGAEPVGASERAVPSWDATYVSPDAEPGELAPPDTAATPAIAASTLAPLTTLRSALLSWDGDARVDAPAVADVRTHSIMPSPARVMADAMSMPMLGDTTQEDAGESWTAPGMVGERARTWSVAQERSSSDLAFDFVTPELVLAARVYGLGPVEAAQAARLAIAGPGQLTAMAGTVDRTFVQAMAIEADRRERQTRAAALATAYPLPTGDLAAVVGPSPRTFEPDFEAMRPEIAASTGAAFGVERRAPRGAFLWPSATVAALQLGAAAPDGEQSMSVAALELLAAQTVAELGTYAALSDHTADDRSAATTARPGTRADRDDTDGAIEPSEHDVLGVAAAMVPAARRARFDALYLSLGQSPVGRTWSPAARAARALALAGRGEDAAVSARERAATAWDVLPVVYAMDGSDESMPVLGSAGSERGDLVEGVASNDRGRVMAARRAMSALAAGGGEVGEPSFAIDARPGLGALSARAGEALGSYVAPASASAPSAPAREREVGAVLRAPTAAQEMVQTGRPSGRFGGGEVEIPTWFEAAARKMFESQSGTLGDGISMAELTLISTTPSNQIAASTKTAPAAAPVSPASASAGQAKGEQQIDVEKLANDIYRHILVLMDVARARNGEPYL